MQPARIKPAEQAGPIWARDTLTGDWAGLRTRLDQAGVRLELQEQRELWSNLAGGLRTGTVYNGLTTASVTVNLEKIIGWTGATFFADAYQIHGSGPSVNLLGNLQTVSNIEAARDTKLYQLWVEQVLFGGRLTIRVGQEGANDQMMNTDYSGLFLNGSFGFPGLAAADLPSGGPNYPIATPFVRVQYKATDRITLVGAAFNSDPAPPGTGDPQLRDKGGTAFRLNSHALVFGELWYAAGHADDERNGLPGTYKLGAWYDSSHYSDQLLDTTGHSLANPASSGIPRSHSTNFAVYGIVDQMVWRNPRDPKESMGLFLQIMGGPAQFNLSNVYVEAGMNWMSPFEGRTDDIFGLAVAWLGISSVKRRLGEDMIFYSSRGVPYRSNETVIEAIYQLQVTPWWTLEPDLQIVINPGGGIPSVAGAKPLGNAVISGVRAIIKF
jgi:porin